MGRLKLLGEQEGGGTDDHSALSSLGYTESGHSGFVPSQGEALIDILRLNQNLIRDSGGNNRIHLATTSPHITLTGNPRIDGLAAIRCAAAPNTLLTLSPDLSTFGAGTIDMIHAQPTGKLPANSSLNALSLLGTPTVPAGSTAELIGVCGLMAPLSSLGTVTKLVGLQSGVNSFAGVVTITEADFFDALNLGFGWGGGKPATLSIFNAAANLGHAAIPTLYGLRIADQTASVVRLLELGPSTPYLRLVGGGDPPANKSNLYLKFGSTLYRVVKSGSYMTLEAA